MYDYSINCFRFNILSEIINIYVSNTENYGHYFKIPSASFPQEIIKISDLKYRNFLFCSSNDNSDATKVEIDITNRENNKFTKQYLNYLLFEHFSNSESFLLNRDFINNTCIYIQDNSFPASKDYLKYNSFTLRFDNNELSKGLVLLLSYTGDSYVLNKNFSELQISPIYLGRVKYNNKVINYKRLSETEKETKEKILPFLNLHIRRYLDLGIDRNYSENRYKKYFDQIQDFYINYLKDVSIKGKIQIFQSGMEKVQNSSIYHTSQNSNLLLFGNNKTHFVPFVGMKQYGPLSADIEKPIKMLFIFHKDDKEYANKLYAYFRKGYKNFPGLESFVNLKFVIDTKNSIQFSSTNPVDEVRDKIDEINKNNGFDSSYSYIAIYISRICKNTVDEELDDVYYKLKEILLRNNIVSQVIYKDNIDNPSFNYFLPNIAIALLAKLGGVPWRLYRPLQNDLVIGIGADRTKKISKPYIGTAFCFKNDGKFVGFDVFEEGDTNVLAQSIKRSIESYIDVNKDIQRLVLHYYKTMNYKEQAPIQRILESLKLSIPFVIVTINENESDDYVLFDNSYDGKMPKSGTFVRIKRNEFLLCNNTRYSESTASKVDGFPLPIKIKIQSNEIDYIENSDVARELIDQVYQFTRMYWKSVRQRNMPVTIEYSKLIAKMVSHFGFSELDDFGRSTLWFL